MRVESTLMKAALLPFKAANSVISLVARAAIGVVTLPYKFAKGAVHIISPKKESLQDLEQKESLKQYRFEDTSYKEAVNEMLQWVGKQPLTEEKIETLEGFVLAGKKYKTEKDHLETNYFLSLSYFVIALEESKSNPSMNLVVYKESMLEELTKLQA